MLQRAAFGTPTEEFVDEHIPDMHWPEYVSWAPLLALIVVLGVAPALLFNWTDDAVQTVLAAIT
jgi:NADH:ubiquinone oxidoreductase subunit 4 (subunit M)